MLWRGQRSLRGIRGGFSRWWRSSTVSQGTRPGRSGRVRSCGAAPKVPMDDATSTALCVCGMSIPSADFTGFGISSAPSRLNAVIRAPDFPFLTERPPRHAPRLWVPGGLKGLPDARPGIWLWHRTLAERRSADRSEIQADAPQGRGRYLPTRAYRPAYPSGADLGSDPPGARQKRRARSSPVQQPYHGRWSRRDLPSYGVGFSCHSRRRSGCVAYPSEICPRADIIPRARAFSVRFES